MNQLEDFRQQIDEFMGHHPQSPLGHEERHNFKGLAYYDENEDLILDVMVERYSEDEPIVTMQTSTGDSQQYRRWGHFSFEVEGKEATLTIYSDPHGHEFFMPFRDAWSWVFAFVKELEHARRAASVSWLVTRCCEMGYFIEHSPPPGG
jgi:uncharacterized protein (DUF1684 family)